MRFLLKLSLALFILFAGIYASTPLWLPHIFARQLPPGWQLENLDAGYPDFSGISINNLRVKGGFQVAGVTLSATDIRYTYRGLKTDMRSLSLDVFMQAATDSSPFTVTLDDLSLPITRLTGKLPEVSVKQLRLFLHTDADLGKTKPLVFDFQSFKLLPGLDNNFHVTAHAGIEGSPEIRGQMNVDASAKALKANIRFPADNALSPWMTVSLEQQHQALITTTSIRIALDAAAVDRQWLNKMLALHTGGMLTNLSGKLEVRAGFSGRELQDIEYLSLVTGQLQTEFDGGTLILDSELLAIREGGQINLTLPRTAKIEYQDTSGKIDEFIASMVPELQRAPRQEALAIAKINPISRFVIQTDGELSLGFNGKAEFVIDSVESAINLHAGDMQFEVTGFADPDITKLNGKILISWTENRPLRYTLDDSNSEPLVIAADEMDIRAQLILDGGDVLSTGNGVFTGGQINPLATSAKRVEVSWQGLDLLTRAGELTTKTQGFSTDLDGETWTGFDFDVVYTLLNNADVSGSGSVKFDTGIDLPVKFAGNVQANQWNITLPASTIKLSRLGSLLRVAHFELPETVKLTDGYIDIQGNVAVADEVSADMTIKGYEMSASMLESSARKASFSFDTSYGRTLTANGPLLIEAVALAGGVDVANVRAELKLENTETFSLNSLYAEVFDGQVNLDSLRISASRIEDTTVELTHISLARLLAFADIGGLEGTGHLDIVLPAGSDQNGIFIKDGTFSADAPGHLAYTKEGVASSNIGLQALENFQYQDLSGTINYQSEGAYQIVVRLEGKNPDLYGGHPIVFNLNISGSLPEVFEAMFITGDFEEAIMNEVRSRQPGTGF